jgi:hypothetical protein
MKSRSIGIRLPSSSMRFDLLAQIYTISCNSIPTHAQPYTLCYTHTARHAQELQNSERIFIIRAEGVCQTMRDSGLTGSCCSCRKRATGPPISRQISVCSLAQLWSSSYLSPNERLRGVEREVRGKVGAKWMFSDLTKLPDGAKASVTKLQHELLHLRQERDTLSRGMQALDGAKSKQVYIPRPELFLHSEGSKFAHVDLQVQKMMELQGAVSTLKYEADFEKKKCLSAEKRLADKQQQQCAELEGAQVFLRASDVPWHQSPA